MKKLKLFFLLTALCFSTISRPVVGELVSAIGFFSVLIQGHPTLRKNFFTDEGYVNLPTLYMGWDFLKRGIGSACKTTDTCLGRIFPRWWKNEENIKREEKIKQQEEHDAKVRLEERNKHQLSETLRLQSDNKELESKCSFFYSKFIELSVANAKLESMLRSQDKELDKMRAQEKAKEDLIKQNATLTTEIAILKKEIEKNTKHEKIINDLKTQLQQEQNNAYINTYIKELKQEPYQYKHALSLFWACAVVFQQSKSQCQERPQLQTGKTWHNNMHQNANLHPKKTGSTVSSFFPKPDTPSVTCSLNQSEYRTNTLQCNEDLD